MSRYYVLDITCTYMYNIIVLNLLVNVTFLSWWFIWWWGIFLSLWRMQIKLKKVCLSLVIFYHNSSGTIDLWPLFYVQFLFLLISKTCSDSWDCLWECLFVYCFPYGHYSLYCFPTFDCSLNTNILIGFRNSTVYKINLNFCILQIKLSIQHFIPSNYELLSRYSLKQSRFLGS